MTTHARAGAPRRTSGLAGAGDPPRRASPRTSAPVHAVRGIDLEIEQGEIVAFLGPNGAGKTTTIDMVLGLSRPTTGDGRGARPGSRARRSPAAWSSAVMQTGGLLKDLTRPRDRRSTPPACSPTPGRSTRCSTSAGIAGIADRKVAKCSGGEQQRLRFAMALLSDPALLLLDEPTTGMDVEGRRAFWSAIRARRRAGPHRAVRDALPRGGRPVRRPDRADQPGPDRRRRHRQPRSRRWPPAAPCAPRCPAPTPRPLVRASAASTASRCAATRCCVHAKDTDAVARYLLTADRRPRPRDHRPRPRGRLPRPDRRRPTTDRRRPRSPR